MSNPGTPAPGVASDDDEADASQRQHVPLVKYGQNIMEIPGDPFGFKWAHSGNIAHWGDQNRAREFPAFPKSDFCFQDEEWAESLLSLLSTLSESFLSGVLDKYEDFVVIAENSNEKVVDFSFQSMSIRVAQFRDVRVGDPKSYYQAQRAVDVEKKSTANMMAIEPPMGRVIENMMMAQAIEDDKAPSIPQFRVSEKHPQGGDNKKKWYKKLRQQVTRAFWVEHSRLSRNQIRKVVTAPADELRQQIEEIQREDNSHSQDVFYQHHTDSSAAENQDIYERVDKDVLLVLDADGKAILCSAQRLFQQLFGTTMMEKVTDAIRKWSALPPLPQPDTARHAVDEIIRRDKHPELDMEKAKTPEELARRASCVVHYGTWAQQGHFDPDIIYLTDDTLLDFHSLWRRFRNRPNFAREVLPRFKRGVFGSSSEVIRFLLRSVAPKEYEDCLEVFKALPTESKMAVSHPDWATLFVLGINSFTERHKDTTDVKQGFAGLIPFGEYEGGDLCFPQLGLQLAYQPGGCVIFRGAELEHYVQDWKGYRIFVLATNHQPVRNWAYRRLGKRAARPRDPWFRGETAEETIRHTELDKEEEEGEYDPCFEEIIDHDPDESPWTDSEIHGAGTWDPAKNLVSSSSSDATTTESENGQHI